MIFDIKDVRITTIEMGRDWTIRMEHIPSGITVETSRRSSRFYARQTLEHQLKYEVELYRSPKLEKFWTYPCDDDRSTLVLVEENHATGQRTELGTVDVQYEERVVQALRQCYDDEGGNDEQG